MENILAFCEAYPVLAEVAINFGIPAALTAALYCARWILFDAYIAVCYWGGVALDWVARVLFSK